MFHAQEAEEKVARPPSAEPALGKEQRDEYGQWAASPQPATGQRPTGERRFYCPRFSLGCQCHGRAHPAAFRLLPAIGW